jgi:hypothetical protein
VALKAMAAIKPARRFILTSWLPRESGFP